MELIKHEKQEVLLSADGYESANYRFDFRILGETSKAIRKRSIATLKEKANFSGFRKGTIPPFIMKDLVSNTCRIPVFTNATSE